MRLASLRPSHSSERKSLTSPAIFQGHSDRVRTGDRSTPDTPATMFFQNGSSPIPTGLTTPIPVTTTRRLFIDCMCSLFAGGQKRTRASRHTSLLASKQGSPRRQNYTKPELGVKTFFEGCTILSIPGGDGTARLAGG